MSFCPSCLAEYRDNIEAESCADCGTALKEGEPHDPPADEMFNIYICFDGQAAERALTLLAEEGLEPLLRDRASSAFPVSTGIESSKLIAVPFSATEQARELLRDAIKDEVLPGKVLG